MTIHHRIRAILQLGNFIGQFSGKTIQREQQIIKTETFFSQFEEEINNAVHYNGWFTRENILFALEQWSEAITEENLEKWIKPYELNTKQAKTIGIVTAGNIPLVGFHDFISVLISGHNVLVKQSSNDQRLLPVLAEYLITVEPLFGERIGFTSGRLENYDAVIATGSNNTARYFEYYFAGKPSIIRKNRNSVAVLKGNETPEELQGLGNDIFRYFGLGCRNVSKLYVPKNYNFDNFYKALEAWKDLMNHAKYANNYDYNKAVYLMSEFKFLDNGFLILKEADEFGSPIGTVFYEKYKDEDSIIHTLRDNREKLQCIVGNSGFSNEVSFGQTQHPELWNYADDIDTLHFLQNL